LSSVLFACGAVLLGRGLARRAVGGTWAPSYAAVAILLGTSLTYYATYMPSYGHALDAFACAAFLAYWAATLGRAGRVRWLVLGALLGAAALIRVQELAMAVVLVVEAVHDLLGPARRRDERWLRSAARWLGRALVVGAVAAVMLGLFLLPRRSRLLAAGLLATVATQVYLNSTIMDYWGMAGFGQRRLCSVTIALVVGLAALIARLGRLRLPPRLAHAVLVTVLAVFIAWNLMRVGEHRAGRAATAEL